MSEEEATSPANPVIKIKKEMDALCDRIAACVPKRPYIMKVDVRPSYDPPPMLANNWKYSCHFRYEWEQYQTFLYRDPGENSLLSLTVQMDEQSKANARAPSPLVGTPKHAGAKKLSLEEYKKKKETQGSRLSSSHDREKPLAEDNTQPRGNGSLTSHPSEYHQAGEVRESAHTTPQKRSLNAKQVPSTRDGSPPAKKPRISDKSLDSEKRHSANNDQTTKTQQSKQDTLKSASSRDKASNADSSKSQQRNLSPPWTSTVEGPSKETDALGKDKSPPWYPETDHKAGEPLSSAFKVQMSASLTHAIPNTPSLSRLGLPLSPKRENQPIAGKDKPAVKGSDANQLVTKPVIRSETRTQKTHSRAVSQSKAPIGAKAPSSTSKSTTEAQDRNPSKPTSKTSGRKSQADAEQSQVASPKPSKSARTEPESSKAHSPVTSSKKRLKEEEIVPEKTTPKKRPKVEEKDADFSPHTPKIVVSQASTTSPTSVQKSAKISPGSRAETSQGRSSVDADTPKASLSTPSKSDGIENAASWKHECDRVQALGRKLKHDSKGTWDAWQAEKADEKKDGLLKLANAQAIEGLICFAQSFAIEDHLNRRDFKGAIRRWESMLPWAREVSSKSTQYPLLRAYIMLFRCACLSRMAAEYGRYSPEDLAKSGNDVSKKLVETMRELTRLTTEYNKILLPSLTKKSYPQALVEAQNLPIGMIVRPMPIVRFGVTLLDEWTEAETVPWKRSHQEGMCSQL